MVLTTTGMNGDKVMKGEEAGAPEGYEFVKDSEGRMAIKKIRTAVNNAVKETVEAVEAITEVPKEIVKAIKPKKSKKKKVKK